MESRGEEVAFADQDREAVACGEGFDLWAGAGDAGGTDEDHLEWAAFDLGWDGEDGGVDLAAVGVALDGDVERVEGGLRGMLNVLGEEDGTGAGAEGGSVLDEAGEGVKELIALEELEHGGGLAAGDDEAVEIDQLFGGANKLGGDAKVGEGLGVGLVSALKGEDADGWC